MEIRCPHCNAAQPTSDTEISAACICSACGETFSLGSVWDTLDLPAAGKEKTPNNDQVEDFAGRWEAGELPAIEDYWNASSDELAALIDLVRIDIEHAWPRGNGKPVEDYLERFPVMLADMAAVFSLFEAEYLARRGSEPELTPAAFAQRYFRLVITGGTSEKSAAEAEQQSLLESLVDQTATWGSGEELPTIGKFRLIELAGKGGFGSVYRAYDPELDREVAVKLTRRDRKLAIDPEHALEEARNAARLAHPGIVPIHEVGEWEQGHYIVSEFVEGVSLASYLTGKRFHFSEATALLKEVAEAVGHAHARGVVHLDLKPSNIMLDQAKIPRILDFGLGRRDGRPVALDLEGRILGTPRYMSPEQAHGNWHTADERADVYSLGVIYFELLTNEPPFRGNPQMLLEQIKREAPPSPRQLNQRIPRDIETIVLKCLEKDPVRRYQSAAELSAELGRVLRDEPILARPVSRVEHVYRWCKRRPALVSWIGGLSSLIIVVTLSAFLLISRSREQERHAKEEAIVFARQALDALNTSYTGVEAGLRNDPDTAAIRLRLLEKAVDDFQRLADQQSDFPELQLERGRVLVRLGDAQRQLGDSTAAAQSYHLAIDIVSDTAVQQLGPAAIAAHSGALTKLADLEASTGKLADAEQHFAQAWDLLGQPLGRSAPRGDIVDAALAATTNHGLLQLRLDKLEAADRLLQRAVEFGPRLHTLDGVPPSAWVSVATAYAGLGDLRMHVGDLDTAAQSFERAAEYYQRMPEGLLRDFQALEARAALLVHMAGVYRERGKFGEEHRAYQEAIKAYAELTKLLPNVSLYREGLALTRADLGQWQHEQGQTRLARETLELALGEFVALASQFRAEPRYFESQAATRDMLGQVLSDLGEADAAEQEIRAASDIYEQLHDPFPAERAYRERLAICRAHHGQILAKQGEVADATAGFDAAVAMLTDLSRQAPAVVSYRESLAHVMIHFGDFQHDQGNQQAARDRYEQAIGLWQEIVAMDQSARAMNDLAWTLATVPVETLRDPAQSRQLAERALQLAPGNPVYLETLAAACLGGGDPTACLLNLELADTARGGLNGKGLVLKSMALADTEESAQAKTSLTLARKWIADRAPGNAELRRLLDEAEKKSAAKPRS